MEETDLSLATAQKSEKACNSKQMLLSTLTKQVYIWIDILTSCTGCNVI